MNPRGEPTTVTFLNQYNPKLHYKYLYIYTDKYSSHSSLRKLPLAADGEHHRNPQLVNIQGKQTMGNLYIWIHLQHNPYA